MSEAINDGGPAFPQMFNTARKDGMGGMTLRDYFAAKAMLSLRLEAAIAATVPGHSDEIVSFSEFADDAYAQADAMLKARNA